MNANGGQFKADTNKNRKQRREDGQGKSLVRRLKTQN